jgi:sterigmatocystin biosynthesis cytochrome P450 monooxygenase
MPPHNFWLGHVPLVFKVLGKLPKDAHPLYMPDEMRRNFPTLGPIYYLDMWPFAPSMLVTASPYTLHQIAQEHVLHKYRRLRDFLYPLTNALDIVTMEGATWKHWRGIFNPGFSSAHLMTLVPGIVKEASTFCQILGEYADRKEIFKMKDKTDDLAMDVIGAVAL